MGGEDKRKGGYRHGGGGGRGGGSHKKHKYNPSSRSGGDGIPRGEKGFIVSYDGNREREAGKDAVNLLTQCWEELQGPAEPSKAVSNPSSATASSALEAELQEMQEQSKPCNSRFFWMKTGINGIVFVKMKHSEGEPGPIELVRSVMEEVSKTKELKSRHIIRMVPVDQSCYASLEDIKKLMGEMCPGAFPASEALKFAVVFDGRAHTGECKDRMTVINAVVDHIPQPPHKVDLTNPDKTVLVQVLKGTCTFAIVEDYQKYMKYNIRSIVNPPESAKPKEVPQKSDQKEQEPAGADAQDDAKKSPPAVEAAAAPSANVEEEAV